MISVLVPVKDGGADLARCLDAINSQATGEDVEIVVVDSGSSDGSPARARELGARVYEVPPNEFNHGRTRNLAAQHARGDVLVFTTQDAYPEDESWLNRLVTPLHARDDIAGVYGRQLPHRDATPLEEFFLLFLYGPSPRLQQLANREEVTFEVTLFSNVNSAIPRAIWERYPFAEDVLMSEDQEWSRRMLLRGWSIVYEPSAAVRHSHAYSFGEAFRRFFDSGASAERAYLGGGPRAKTALRAGARRYARQELEWLWRTGRRRWLPYAAVYELAKYAGLQLGRRHHRLPAALKRRLSSYPSYW
jgi:rhamnosyltransferase